MICKEQADLANELKKVHLWLRKRSKEVGGEQAWEEHLNREVVLKKYSVCMKKLAEKYWDTNNTGVRSSYCRIAWITKVLEKYYLNGTRTTNETDSNLQHAYKGKLKVLDVGSCYDPFKKIEFVDSTAIDLFPATSSVVKCDFLGVNIISNDGLDAQSLLKLNNSLPENYFAAVIFCLFIEYLPVPTQRLKACQLARDVLQENGLLIIVTPDSKHKSANSALMKTWKHVLADIGFTRICIEKLPYLHCMAFEKNSTAVRIAPVSNKSLWIPQDFIDYTEETAIEALPREHDDIVAESFDQLPFVDVGDFDQ